MEYKTIALSTELYRQKGGTLGRPPCPLLLDHFLFPQTVHTPRQPFHQRFIVRIITIHSCCQYAVHHLMQLGDLYFTLRQILACLALGCYADYPIGVVSHAILECLFVFSLYLDLITVDDSPGCAE